MGSVCFLSLGLLGTEREDGGSPFAASEIKPLKYQVRKSTHEENGSHWNEKKVTRVKHFVTNPIIPQGKSNKLDLDEVGLLTDVKCTCAKALEQRMQRERECKRETMHGLNMTDKRG